MRLAYPIVAGSMALSGVLGSVPVRAQECPQAQGSALASALQPVLDATNPCADLRQEVDLGFMTVTIALDTKERFVLQSLEYCLSDTTSQLRATIDLSCRTPPDAGFPASVSETFDIDATLANADCRITALDVRPRGTIGGLVADFADLSERLRGAIQPHLTAVCQRR